MNPVTSNLEVEHQGSSQASPDVAWGEKEQARQIALLEAHLLEEKIHFIIDRAQLIRADDRSSKQRDRCIATELYQSYLDYAIAIITGETVPYRSAIKTLQGLSRKAAKYFPNLTHRFSAALALHCLKTAQNLFNTLFLKLLVAADTAVKSLPLFLYGPELSEFRHRHR